MEQEHIEAYMRAFLFELECALNNSDSLLEVSFQSDEANTDKELKKAIKTFILNKCNKITKIKKVIIDGSDYPIDSNKFKILQALIPDDYCDDIRNLVKESKTSVYVNPDMVLQCDICGDISFQYIELKSTKNDKIPGSSVQQIQPDEWVIFVKHTDDSVQAITGQYKNSISGTMQFPDRSPRPQVSYKELMHWLNDFRGFTEGVLEFKHDDLSKEKNELLTDWQGVLSHRWMKVLVSEKKKKEPWFNNNLRKFVLELLLYYDNLTDEEKCSFKQKIEENVSTIEELFEDEEL